MIWLEIAANSVNAASILLAARNSWHTWWIGIIGCALFAALFHRSQLYADALLQLFFIGTSIYGWKLWTQGRNHAGIPIARSSKNGFLRSLLVAALVALAYGYALHRLTDAYAPFVDSLILAFSVLAQLLLMKRRYETWWLWILVNTLTIGLFASRGLWITAALYVVFWVNAVWAVVSWKRLIARE